MAHLQPQEPKVPPAAADNMAPPGTAGTEQAPTTGGLTDPTQGGDPSADPSQGAQPDAGSDADGGGQGGLVPGQEAPDPSADQPAGDDAQGLTNAAPPDAPHMAGTVQDAKDAAVQDDPEAEIDASPEEQAEYDQIVSRFLLFICSKQKSGDGPSASETIIQHLNNPKLPIATALGVTTAHAVFTIVQAARSQKVTYSAEVLFHASEELVSAVYLIGLAAGVIKGMPPFKGMPDDGDYDFDASEIKLLGEARMQAVKEYGTMLVKSGQLTADQRAANQDFWKQQINREVSQGNVADAVLAKLNGAGAFDKLHDHMAQGGMPKEDPSQAAAPAPQPDQQSAGSATAPPPDDGSGAPPAAPTDGSQAPGLVPPDAGGAQAPTDTTQAGGA